MTTTTGNEIINTLKTTLRMKDGRSKASKLDRDFVVSNLDHYRKQGGVFFRAYEIGFGIVWAYRTGRLTYEAEQAISKLNALGFVKLIGEVSDNCPTQGSIPQYLNNR